MDDKATITEETDALIGRGGDESLRVEAENVLNDGGRSRPKASRLPVIANPAGASAEGLFNFIDGINDRNWQREQQELAIRQRTARQNLQALDTAAATNQLFSSQSQISQARIEAKGDAQAFQKAMQDIYQSSVSNLPVGARAIFSSQYLGIASNAVSSYTAEQQRINNEANKAGIYAGIEHQQGLAYGMYEEAETEAEKQNAISSYYASLDSALQAGALTAAMHHSYRTDFDQNIAASEIGTDGIERIKSGDSITEVLQDIQGQGLSPAVIEKSVKRINDYVKSVNSEASTARTIAADVNNTTIDGFVAVANTQGASVAMAQAAALREEGKIDNSVYAEVLRELSDDRKEQEGLRLTVFSQANSENLTQKIITDAWKAVAINREEFLALQSQFETQNLAKRGDVKASLSLISLEVEKSYGGAINSILSESSARTPMKQAEGEYLRIRQGLEETGEWNDSLDNALVKEISAKYQNPKASDKIEVLPDSDLQKAVEQAEADKQAIRTLQQRLKLLDLGAVDSTEHLEDISSWQLLQAEAVKENE